MQYYCVVFRTILLRILSSLQITFCSVVKEMDCMSVNDYDVFYLEYCFICHSAPAFPSLLLITVLIYLLPSILHSVLLSLLSLLLIDVSSYHSSFL